MAYRILTILMGFFLVTSLQAYQSAHVIVINQNEEIVLGLTRTGKLSTFGGLRDPGESEPIDTAARETEEEALGVFGDRQTLRSCSKRHSLL